MNPRCPECQNQFERSDSGGRIVHHCRACGNAWLSFALLRVLVRDAVNAAGVKKKAIGLVETPARAIDVNCPMCPLTHMQQIELRGVPVGHCETCDGVFLQRGEFLSIVRRVVDAETGWSIAEADWAIIYQKVRLEAAKRQAASDPGMMFLF